MWVTGCAMISNRFRASVSPMTTRVNVCETGYPNCIWSSSPCVARLRKFWDNYEVIYRTVAIDINFFIFTLLMQWKRSYKNRTSFPRRTKSSALRLPIASKRRRRHRGRAKNYTFSCACVIKTRARVFTN